MNFELELKKHLKKAFSLSLTGGKNSSSRRASGQELLKKSLFYSFRGNVSHFRPKLCFETTQFLGHKSTEILPWALALEMAHTASLIHDDMPCMDDGRERRGQKCNHLVFGEEIALLAGTCLFIESFSLLKSKIFDKKREKLLELLVSTLGFQGLMSGQAMDLHSNSFDKKHALETMKLKTGVLISACVMGPSLLWADKKEFQALEKFAKHLGLAYQLADDYQDIFQDEKSFTLSKQKSQSTTKNSQAKQKSQTAKKNWLHKQGLSQLDKSKKALAPFPKKNKGLNSLIDMIKKK